MPGRNVGMAAGLDVGIDPDRHACDRALRRGDALDPQHLAWRLDIDGADAQTNRALQFGARLPDAGHDDVGGGEARAQSDFQFAGRVDVGTRAQVAQSPHDRKRRVRFESVVQAMGGASPARDRASGTGSSMSAAE